MKGLRICWIAAFVLASGSANGLSFNRIARSGQPTIMRGYQSFKSDCSVTAGMVRIVVLPQHGKLRSVPSIHPIGSNRFNPTDPCIGKPVRESKLNILLFLDFEEWTASCLRPSLENRLLSKTRTQFLCNKVLVASCLLGAPKCQLMSPCFSKTLLVQGIRARPG
jgi:hypothetical protein